MRCSVEIFINHYYNEKNLVSGIEKLVKSLGNEENQDFALFVKSGKKDELKNFLTEIKDLGNDAAHLNGKKIEEFTDKHDNKELLKLFCLLIENSLLKQDIAKKDEEEKRKLIASLNFNFKNT